MNTDGKHALVMLDGCSVPLIGIPPAAVLELCDLCGDEFPTLEVELQGSQMLCRKCRGQHGTASSSQAIPK